MSERSAMSVFDVVAVDHLTSLQKNTDRNSAPKQLRDHRRRHGTLNPSLSYTKSLPATPKISRKSSPDTLRKSMARHQESLSRAGSPFGSSTTLVPPSSYHAASDLGLITSSTRSNDDILRSSNRSNDDISRLSKRSNDNVSRLTSRNNDDILRSSSRNNDDILRSSGSNNDDILRSSDRNNDDILRSSDRNNDDITTSSSRYQRINKRFERTRFSNQRGPTPFLDRRTPSPNTSRDSSPSRTINRSAVPANPCYSTRSTDGICSRTPGLYRRATLQPDRRPFQKPRSSKTAFGHSPLGSKEDNRYKTPYSSDENVDLISTNYPYTDHLYASSHTLPRNYRLNSIVGPSCESREVLLGRYPSLSSSRGSTPARTPRDLSPLRSSRGITPLSSMSARSSRHTSPVRSSRGVTPLNSISARTSRNTSPVRLSRGVTPLSSRGATPLSSRGATPTTSTRSSRQTSPVRSSARSSRKSSPSSNESMDTSAIISAVGSRLYSSKYTTTPGAFGCSINKLREESNFIKPVRDVSPSSSIKSSRKSSLASSPVSNTRSGRKLSPPTSSVATNRSSPVTSFRSNRNSSPTSSPVSNNRSSPVTSPRSSRKSSPTSCPASKTITLPVTSLGSNRNSSPTSCPVLNNITPSVTSLGSNRPSSPTSCTILNTASPPVTSLGSNRISSPTSCSVPNMISLPVTSLESDRSIFSIPDPRSSPVTSFRPDRQSVPTNSQKYEKAIFPSNLVISTRRTSPAVSNQRASPTNSVISGRNISPEIQSLHDSTSCQARTSLRSSPTNSIISNKSISSKETSPNNSIVSHKGSSPTSLNGSEVRLPLEIPDQDHSGMDISPLNTFSEATDFLQSPRKTSPVKLSSSKSSQRSSPVTEPITPIKSIESSSPRSSRKTSPIMLRAATTSCQRTSPEKEPILDSQSQKSSRRTSPVALKSTKSREPIPASSSRRSSRRTSPVTLKSTKSSRRTSPVREPMLSSSSQRSSRRTSPVPLKSSKSSRRTSPVRERITSPIWINSTSRRQSPDSSQHLDRTTSNRGYSPSNSVRSSRRTSPDSSQHLQRPTSNRGYSPVNSVRSSRRTSPVRPNKKAYPTVTRELAANSKIPRISSEFIDKLSKDVADELEDTLSLTGSISLMDTHKSVHSDSGIGEELVLSGDEKPVKKYNYDFASIDRSQLEKLLKSVTDKKQEDADEGEDDDLHLENSPSTEVAPDLVRRQSVIIQGLVMETEELREKVATLEDELATVPYVEEMQDKLGAFERKLDDSESYVYQLLEENIDMKTEMETLEIEINEAQDHFRDNDAREFKKTKWELETMSKSVRNLQLKLKKAQLKAALLRQEKEELEEKQKEAAMWRGAVVVGAVLAATFWKLKS